MKILQLVTRRQLRGAEVFAAQLADHLIDAGHRTRLLGLYPPPPEPLAPQRAEARDLDLRPWPGLRPGLVLRLKREIDAFAPDVIQANGSDTLKYAVAARRLAHHSPALVYRNISFASRWGNDPFRRALYRRLFRSVDAVAAVSEGAARDFEATYGISSERLTVIPNATPIPQNVDAAASRQRLVDLAGGTIGDVLLLHVGSFTAEKNHVGLARSFAGLSPPPGSTLRLVLLGDGPLRDTVRRQVRELGLEDRVRAPGARSDAAELMAGCDVLVLPSFVEGVPGVLLEAGARRVPVVASAVGGVPELIEEGVTGLLVPPGDDEALATALERLVRNPRLRHRLGDTARRHVEAHHDLGRVAEEFLKLYGKLCEPEPQIHVLQLIKGLGRGGAERLLVTNQRASRERSSGLVYEYAYLLPHKGNLAPELRSTGAPAYCLGFRGGAIMLPFTVLRLAWFLRRRTVDLLHVHLPVSGVVGRLAGKLAGVPVVYTEHNLHERYHPWTRRLNLWTWGLQRHVVAVSQDVAASIERHAGHRVPVTVIENGVPVDELRADPEGAERIRRETGIDQEAPVVGTVAVFRAQKRLDRWLDAAALLASEHAELRFLLVGDGPEAEVLHAQARRLQLEDRIVWAGLQEDVRPWVSAMDVFLVSSDYEGLPVAVLEALALERPVVATAVGGVAEVIDDDVEGRLVPAGKAKDLATAVASLLSDPARARELGQRGRRRVASEHSTARMLDRLESLYRKVLDREEPAP